MNTIRNCNGRCPRSLSRNVWKIYVLRALMMNLALALPTIVIFWRSNGLSMMDVMLLQALFALALAVLEVPSGYCADVLGRKHTLVAASIVMTIAVGIYCAGSSFLQFLIAELLLAVTFSLISGADQALLYDSLVLLRHEHKYAKLWGRANALEKIFAGCCCVLGGFLAAYNLRWPWLAALAGSAAMIPIALLLEEPPRTRLCAKEGHFRELAKIAGYCLYKNRHIGWLILLSALTVGVMQPGLWLYQPYFELCELPVIYFGWVFAGMNLVAALGSVYAHRLARRLGRSGSCAAIMVLLAAGYFLMGQLVYVWSFMFIMLHQFVRGFRMVALSDFLNAETTSDIRATTISLMSMAERVLYMAVLLPVGWLADELGILPTFNLLGVGAIAAGVLAWLLFPRKAR